MATIKKSDSRPFFQAYSIIQEGVSKPRVIGESSAKPIYWVKDVVNAVKDVIKEGLQFFLGHNKDNSTNGRKELGRVVGKLTRTINGKLNQIVVGYFPDKKAVEELDVISMEADVLISEKPERNDAKKIENMSGIAMANSRIEKPAFAGAVRLATLQCFDDTEQKTNPADSGRETKKMTYEEFKTANFDWFKQAIRDRAIFPSQLGFSEDDLRKDNAFTNHFNAFDETSKKAVDFEKQLNEEKENRKKETLESQRATSSQRLEKMIPEGFTDLQKNFVLKTFEPSALVDLSDDALKKYVEESKGRYKKHAEIFGKESANDTGNDTAAGENSTTKGERFEDNSQLSVEEQIKKDIMESE